MDHLPFVGDQDAILDEVEEFLTGVRHETEPDTVLATVMVARMVDVKELAERLGPERWSEWLRRLHAHITKEIEWFRGREIDIVGESSARDLRRSGTSDSLCFGNHRIHLSIGCQDLHWSSHRRV